MWLVQINGKNVGVETRRKTRDQGTQPRSGRKEWRVDGISFHAGVYLVSRGISKSPVFVSQARKRRRASKCPIAVVDDV